MKLKPQISDKSSRSLIKKLMIKKIRAYVKAKSKNGLEMETDS